MSREGQTSIVPTKFSFASVTSRRKTDPRKSRKGHSRPSVLANAPDPPRHKRLLALIKAHCRFAQNASSRAHRVHSDSEFAIRGFLSMRPGVISPDALSVGMVYIPHIPNRGELLPIDPSRRRVNGALCRKCL